MAHVTVAGMKEDQMLRSGSSYLSQSDLVLTFGLGTHVKADAVVINWPSGQVDKLSNVAGGQTVTIQEGHGIVASRRFARRAE